MPTDLTSFTTLKAEQRGAVVWIWLDRPDKYHAFNKVMCDELSGLWRALKTDDSVRSVVLTATGDKAFCTGIDRDFVPAEGGVEYDFSPFSYDDPGKYLGPKSNEFWKPVVCAVNGMACGGAFYLLGEVDFIISADHATYFDPHVTYGMAAIYEPALLLHRMPFGEVARLALLGAHERISAQRAHEVGFVSEVVPLADLQEAAMTVARQIASQPPLAVQSTVRSLWAARELTRQQMLGVSNAFLAVGTRPEALTDGQQAFAGGTRITPRVR